MDRNEILNAIQQRIQVDSHDSASIVTHATLSVLGQCIDRSASETLASQLPEDLANALCSENETTNEFSAAKFAEEVHRREVNEEQFKVPPTNQHIRAVLEVINRATDDGALDEIRDQLPADYNSLFEPDNGGNSTQENKPVE